MKPTITRCRPLRRLATTACLALLMAHTAALAAPGAHGPNGEHLDAPTSQRAAAALPRVEASSDAFELVAELRTSELAILVDRYASNEPVLGATLTVDSGSLKALAAFRADAGDYAVTDAAMLKALAAPGEHALVFTLIAGQDSDLLDGTLVATAAQAQAGHDHDHDHGHDHDHDHPHGLERAAWLAAGITAVGLVGLAAWWRQRRRGTTPVRGGL